MDNLYNNRLQFQYMLYLLYKQSILLENKYIKKKDIILYNFYHKNYDKSNDLHITYCILDIQIYTFINRKTNFKKHIVYKDKIIISSISTINDDPIDNKINIISSIVFLDNLKIVNYLDIYNCGIIIHKNAFINHIYNFMNERRCIDE